MAILYSDLLHGNMHEATKFQADKWDPYLELEW